MAIYKPIYGGGSGGGSRDLSGLGLRRVDALVAPGVRRALVAGPVMPRQFGQAPGVVRAALPGTAGVLSPARRRLAQEAAWDYMGALGGTATSAPLVATLAPMQLTVESDPSADADIQRQLCERGVGTLPAAAYTLSDFGTWREMQDTLGQGLGMTAWPVFGDNPHPAYGRARPGERSAADRIPVSAYLEAMAQKSGCGSSVNRDVSAMAMGRRNTDAEAVGFSNFPHYPPILTPFRLPWGGLREIGYVPTSSYVRLDFTPLGAYWLGRASNGLALTSSHVADLFLTDFPHAELLGYPQGTRAPTTSGNLIPGDFLYLVDARVGYSASPPPRGCTIAGFDGAPRHNCVARDKPLWASPRRMRASIFTNLLSDGALNTTTIALPGHYPLAVTAVAERMGYDFEREADLVRAHQDGAIHLAGCRPPGRGRFASVGPDPRAIVAARSWPVSMAHQDRQPWVFYYDRADRIVGAAPATFYTFLADAPRVGEATCEQVVNVKIDTWARVFAGVGAAFSAIINSFFPNPATSYLTGALVSVASGSVPTAGGMLGAMFSTISSAASSQTATALAGDFLESTNLRELYQTFRQDGQKAIGDIVKTASQVATTNRTEAMRLLNANKLRIEKTVTRMVKDAGVPFPQAIAMAGEFTRRAHWLSERVLKPLDMGHVDLSFDWSEAVRAYAGSADSGVARTVFGGSAIDSASDLVSSIQLNGALHKLAPDPSVFEAALDFETHKRTERLGLAGTSAGGPPRLVERAALDYQSKCSPAALEAWTAARYRDIDARRAASIQASTKAAIEREALRQQKQSGGALVSAAAAVAAFIALS